MEFNKEHLRKFVLEEIMSEEIYELMKSCANFMVFVHDKKILMEEEAEKWIAENGYDNPNERIIYTCPIKNELTNKPILYTFKYTSCATSCLITGKEIGLGYDGLLEVLKDKIENRNKELQDKNKLEK